MLRVQSKRDFDWSPMLSAPAFGKPWECKLFLSGGGGGYALLFHNDELGAFLVAGVVLTSDTVTNGDE